MTFHEKTIDAHYECDICGKPAGVPSQNNSIFVSPSAAHLLPARLRGAITGGNLAQIDLCKGHTTQFIQLLSNFVGEKVDTTKYAKGDDA